MAKGTLICKLLFTLLLNCALFLEISESKYANIKTDQHRESVLRKHSVNLDRSHESDMDLSSLLSDALSKSKLIQEHSQVFIQLGKYLVQNSTKPEQRPRVKFEKRPPSADAANVDERFPTTATVLPGYAAWPVLHLFPANTTMSEEMKPPGYLKHAGKDFNLDQNILEKMKAIIVAMDDKHVPSNRSTWERLGIYDDYKGTLNTRRAWHNMISRYDLYPENYPALMQSVKDLLSHGEITEVQDTGDSGTQIKFIVYLDDDLRAMVKPIRYSREQETLPNHFYFSDHERHIAEIAAYHLDRLLNFRRVPPVMGRLINMTSEIYEPGEDAIRDEFFTSPAGNVCYRGNCDYYCSMHYLTCGRPDMLEVSMMAFLPSRNRADRSSWEHPWRKSYSSKKPAAWEGDDNYCDDVRNRPYFKQGRGFLDLMDLAVFDFLTGNTDRHHFNTFEKWDNDTAFVVLDSGKGFGNSREDEFILLLPLSQCCAIRFTTLRTLLHFHNGPKSLGESMRQSMATDLIAPVLVDSHLDALDRRVKIILKTIGECLSKKPSKKVILDDGF